MAYAMSFFCANKMNKFALQINSGQKAYESAYSSKRIRKEVYIKWMNSK